VKTIDLTEAEPSLQEILREARAEPVFLKAATGERWLLSPADDFALEVELLRANHKFLAYLDTCRTGKAGVSLEEAEARRRQGE
jgi:hypothetical protein